MKPKPTTAWAIVDPKGNIKIFGLCRTKRETWDCWIVISRTTENFGRNFNLETYSMSNEQCSELKLKEGFTCQEIDLTPKEK